MANEKYFGRVYRLTLSAPGGDTKTFEVKDGYPAMDIKFDVTYARGQTAREGTVSVLGLGYETIHEFIAQSARDRGTALSERLRLVLEVGYFSTEDLVEVLNGFVYYASVTSPPQMWLNMKVSEYDPLGGKLIRMPILTSGLSMRVILDKLCKCISDEDDGEGVEFQWEDKTEDGIIQRDNTPKTIDFGDAAALGDIIAKLNSDVSDKVRFVLRTSKSDDTRIIECHDIDDRKAVKGVVEVDKQHGLLSVTGIDVVSGCVTTFLDGSQDDELCHLHLTSELNPQANGRYYIVKKQYVGHFMGQEWYARYFCSAREED